VNAASALGSRFLPSNLEVAIELDRIAGGREGQARQERLIRMRQEALAFMRLLKAYSPVLVGSVWRGTINHNSDIDIIVYHDQFDDVLNTLKKNRIRITDAEQVIVTKKGKWKGSFHIHAESLTKEMIEIKVASPQEVGTKVKCEIYGDQIVGLRIGELKRLLKENPTRRFVHF